tara:strand:+ start:9094 stop:9297 length:204 start_codon:yes stop_codon:yes gene_type:complete
MMNESVIKQIQNKKCWHCDNIISEHSKKNLMRCHYATEINLYKAVKKIGEMSKELEEFKSKKEVKDE